MASVCSGETLNFLRYSPLVRLECFAVLLLHERHAEHVDGISLPRPFGVKDKGARDIVIIVSLGHKRFSDAHADAFSK
jgi:hypothetical protein